MAGKIKGITIEIGGDTQKLNKSLEDVNKKTRDVQSELRQVERLLKLDPGNTELLAQKQKLLAEAVDNSREKLDRLRAAQSQVEEQFRRGEIGEEQYRAFQREVVQAEQQLQRFEDRLRQTQQTSRNWGAELQKTGEKLKGFGATMSAAVTAPIVGGFVALTQGTKEFRGDLARLSANAEVAGQDMDILNDAMARLHAVTGEVDSNVEGLSNLLATGFRDEQLSELLDHLYGAAIKFSDTLKFEGISDGLQETLATGAAIGPFAELLERSGIVLDDFNAGLEAAIANGKEEEYILEVLANTGLAGTYEAWKKQNEEMVKAEEANFRMQQAFANLGATLEPILTPLIEGVTQLVNKFSEMEPATQKIILVIAGVAAAIGPLLIGIGTLMTAVSGIIPLLGGGAAAGGLAGAFAAITGPIGIAIAAIAAITAVIVHLWKTNEEFRENVMAIWEQIKELFTVAFEKIKSIIMTFYEGIKTWWEEHSATILKVLNALWNTIATIFNTALGVIRGLFDVFIGLFTGDWERMGDGVKKIFASLWGGIKNIVANAWNILKGAFSVLWDSIAGWFNNLVSSAVNWGKNLISGFVDGIKSMIGKVKDAVSGVIGAVSDFLGFNSPAKKGEGRNIVKWGYNMIEGFMEGMQKALPQLQLSAKTVVPVIKNEIINTAQVDYSKIPKGDTIIHVYNPQPSPAELAQQIKKQQQELALGF